MNTLNHIRGIIFDYGGTIDTDGRHWAEVLWSQYLAHRVPVSREAFREAYVHGERTLARTPLVQPHHNFHDVLTIKVRLQMEYLVAGGLLTGDTSAIERYVTLVADSCYDYVLRTLETTRPVVARLAEKYRLVLVSNFYGNIETILQDFGLHTYFSHIVESSVVGVRKPDPAIYRLGVEAMGYDAAHILVVGDSYSKDIVPAKQVGCCAAWLRGEGWGDEVVDESLPDLTITSLAHLPAHLSIENY